VRRGLADSKIALLSAYRRPGGASASRSSTKIPSRFAVVGAMLARRFVSGGEQSR
jgi:hypothetical protein